MLNITVNGAAGRMGRIITAYVLNDPELNLVGAIEAPGSPAIGQDAGFIAGLPLCGVKITDDADAALAGADVLIDFTFAAVTRVLAPKAASKNIAIVVGSTALTAEDHQLIDKLCADGARIVQAANMSLGVNLLFELSRQAAAILGEDYDIEIVEMHHNQKKDAPSGTAEKLGQVVAAARGLNYDTDTRHGRQGIVGARTKQEIGMHSMRGGDVVGDHTVIFATTGERVELTHKASSRETFVKGAIRAAKFLAGVKAGRYDMQDVLGLRK